MESMLLCTKLCSYLGGGMVLYATRTKEAHGRMNVVMSKFKVPDGRQWLLYKMQPIPIFKHLRFDQTFFTYKNKGNG